MPDGTECKSYGALGEKWGDAAGYCIGHARRLKLLPPEVEEKRKARMSRTATDIHAERDKQERKILSKGAPVGSPEFDEEVKKFYHDVVGDKDFDLRQLKEDLVAMGAEPIFKETDVVKQKLFMDWFVADIDTREPKTIKGVAEILEVRQMTIREWMTSEVFANGMNERRLRVAMMISPFIDKINNFLALGGNRNAIAKHYELYGKPKVSNEEPEEFGDASPEMNEKAERLAGGKTLNFREDEQNTLENLVELEPIKDESE